MNLARSEESNYTFTSCVTWLQIAKSQPNREYVGCAGQTAHCVLLLPSWSNTVASQNLQSAPKLQMHSVPRFL